MKKVCSKCKEEKDISEYSIRSDTKKPRGQCKECREKYLKEYDKQRHKISVNQH